MTKGGFFAVMPCVKVVLWAIIKEKLEEMVLKVVTFRRRLNLGVYVHCKASFQRPEFCTGTIYVRSMRLSLLTDNRLRNPTKMSLTLLLALGMRRGKISFAKMTWCLHLSFKGLPATMILIDKNGPERRNVGHWIQWEEMFDPHLRLVYGSPRGYQYTFMFEGFDTVHRRFEIDTFFGSRKENIAWRSRNSLEGEIVAPWNGNKFLQQRQKSA